MPIAAVTATDSAMPSSTLTRGPSFGPIRDARNWPIAYAIKYAA